MYLLFDFVGVKNKCSDYMLGWVVGFGLDGNVYVLDMVWDCLNLI